MTQNWFNPWASLWGGSSFAEPFSGDVSQLFRIFSPTITVEGKGDPDLETRIVRDVATYGSQIGQLTEIVLALAANRPPPADAVKKLTEIAADVQKLKEDYRKNTRDRAAALLADLKAHDLEGYRALVATL